MNSESPFISAISACMFLLVVLASCSATETVLIQSAPPAGEEVDRSLAELGADSVMRQDVEKIRNRVIDQLLEPPVDDEEIGALMNSIHENGSWPGINYEDTSRTGFEHSMHLANMIKLSRAFQKPESKYYRDPDLKRTARAALDFWIGHDFICENWWWNEIGTPERVGNFLLMMDDHLTERQKKRAAPIVGRANLGARGARPGGDLIKIAGIMGKYALFARDDDLLQKAVTAIAGEIGFAADRGDPADLRGLQTDFSFHHRNDRVTSTITYGHGYVSYFADWAEKVAGTVFGFPDESIELTVDFFLDGISKTMAYGMYPDPGAGNRAISRPGALNPRSAELPEMFLRITTYREKELEAFAAIRRGDLEPDLKSNTFFWHTEYVSHQRPHYFTSVRMYSTRNHSVEVPYNSEGLKNHHLADGYTYITRTGQEYRDIFPVWDWQKIPGTTVVQKSSMPAPGDVQQAGLRDFVGGVTNGMYGAAVFDFASPLDSLSARKSWFFFDEEFVALGSDIRSGSEYPVTTTLNQSLLNGEVLVAETGNESTVSRGEHELEDVAWVHHDSTAYLFPSAGNVRLENHRRSGYWKDINRQSWSYARDKVEKEVFTLWLDHGVSPQHAGYEYIVVPDIEASAVARYSESPPVKILTNTPQTQAVQHSGLGISQIVFYESGEIELAGGMTLEVDSPGLVMVRGHGQYVEEIVVSDPSRTLNSFHVRINTHFEAAESNWADVSWNEEEGLSTVEFKLPAGQFAGQSISIATRP